MPHSLRCKIKHLCHNGTLTERERDRILEALEQTQWIPVSERLPDGRRWILCYCVSNIYEVLMWTDEGWEDGCDRTYMKDFVIAWMPLPEPYKAESKDKGDE